jgi:hypothetical protein
MDRADQAVAKFVSGYNCAQAVLFSFCDDLGLDKDKALKIACGFGAGRGENEDRKATDNTYIKIRELMNQFSQRHGTYICRQLLNGCELTTEEGQKIFKENDYLNHGH